MRTKKVTRYYCDHCSKGMLKRIAMERHEVVCYSNPNRKCHACFNRDEFKPVAIESRSKPITTIGNECPHFGANKIANIEHPDAFECGAFGNTHRTWACKAREPLWKELQAAKTRIADLVKVGDEIIENGSVSERLADEWKKAKGGAV